MDKQKAKIGRRSGKQAEYVAPEDAHTDSGTVREHDRSDGFEDRVSAVALQIIFLIHGTVIGGAMANIILGLFIGIVAGALLDLCMGTQSLVLACMRCVATKLCSAVTSMAHAIASGISRKRVSAPSRSENLQCRFSP